MRPAAKTLPLRVQSKPCILGTASKSNFTSPMFGAAPLLEMRKPAALLRRYNSVAAANLETANQTLAMPQLDEVLYLVSQKEINAYTLLRWAIEELGTIEDMFLTTYNLNADIIRALSALLDTGQVRRLSIVLSQSIEYRMPERVKQLREEWEIRRESMRVSFCWNHSKVALLRPANSDHRLVITGSGNYSYNAVIEQYEIINSPAVYRFFYEDLEARCFGAERMNKRHHTWEGNHAPNK